MHEQPGLTSGNKSTVVLSTLPPPQVCLAVSDSAITLVRVPLHLTAVSMLTLPSGQVGISRLLRDACQRGLQVQHSLQRYCTHRRKPDDTNSYATRRSRKPQTRVGCTISSCACALVEHERNGLNLRGRWRTHGEATVGARKRRTSQGGQ